jgi:uncharacterized protein
LTAVLSGVGIGLRRELAAELLHSARRLDWLEVIPENWLRQGGWIARMLDACSERWPMTPHCVSLSVGGPDPLDEAFIADVEAFSRRLGAPWWSDHVACAQVHGVAAHAMLPVPHSEAELEHVARRVGAIQRRSDRPFLLENHGYDARLAGTDMTEAAFLRQLVDATGVGLLLDVTTALVTARNHAANVFAFLDALPMDRVFQIHVAGHGRAGDRLVDDQSGPVTEEAWSLYRHVIARAGRPIPTLVETDNWSTTLDAILDQVDRARSEMERALADVSPLEMAAAP